MKLSYVCCLLILLKPQAITHTIISSEILPNTSDRENKISLYLNADDGRAAFDNSSFSPLKQVEPDHISALEKIEVLGEVLKKKVEMFREHEDHKVDLVFLIDSSHSIGAKNFNSELKFVKKLLANFTISQNKTRVAVITFSDKIIRYVDHISVSSEDYHKCNMLHNDFHNIHFVGGNTDTLGALVEAQSVLEWSRADAKKAVFLVTDGFSNGGDPEPVARILKENGTFIFTFGIQSGNTKELQSISSSPLDEFLYLLESFDQFEALARRALHHDLSTGPHQILKNTSLCDTLCSFHERGENGCCDQKAHCSCGTASGHYTCLCFPSYYGSGLLGSCTPCPNGTYHDGMSSGDESVCVRCPDPNHITILRSAVSKADCFCKRGFVGKGDTCEVITCPRLFPPEHGYFVKGQGTCPNVFNAACGMRCKVGYTLHGTSIRLCQEDGTWSGTAPTCIVKMCPSIETPNYGNMKCSRELTDFSDDLKAISEKKRIPTYQFAVDTVCEFSCEEGSVLIGSKRRVCLPLARWDGLRTICKPVLCAALPKLAHGSISPVECTRSAKLPFGHVCNITCDEGFQLIGPSSRNCKGKGGHWSLKSNSSKCIDIEPPHIACPSNLEVPTETGKHYAIVSWPEPSVSDNSGKTPLVWTQPIVTNPINVPIGSTYITYIALDSSHNQATCVLNITVVDTEAPIVQNCISPSPVYLVGQNRSSYVAWALPEFHDNSGRDVTVHSSHQFGEFSAGKTEVVITGSDWTGNNSTCLIQIIVKDQLCSISPYNVYHGSTSCEFGPEMLNCRFSCHQGFSFDESGIDVSFFQNPGNGSLLFSCPLSRESLFPSVHDLPTCSEKIPPIAISQEGFFSISGDASTCEDFDLIEKAQKIIETSFSNQSSSFCQGEERIECLVVIANASCEEVVSAVEEKTNNIHHSKRSAGFSRRESRVEQLSSVIQVNLNVVAELRRALEKASNPDHRFFQSGLFGELKSSIRNSEISLPQGMRFHSLSWKEGSAKFKCQEGSIPLVSGDCLKCPPGTFFSNQTEKCHPCPLGKYQEEEGQLQCKSCPAGMATKLERSRNLGDCQYLCPPGFYGLDVGSYVASQLSAIPPCILCPPGFYQSNYGATSCISCPENKFILSRSGAKSEKECGDVLADNTSFIAHCHSELCHNGGLCSQTANGFLMCKCSRGFYGSLCELVVNSCDSDPCLHGGLCIFEDSFKFRCSCPPGFQGDTCEEEINECKSNPCLNYASCEDLMNGYYCDCPAGFQGERCEEAVNHCINDPCGSHGECKSDISGYTCSCFNGFSGQNCEIVYFNACANAVCLNGASCHSLNHSTYECICLPQYHGPHCEWEKMICSSSPCINNSTCIEREGRDLFCRCPPYFAGKYCQTQVLPEFVLNFPSSSVTDYAVVNFPPLNLTQVSVCLWLQSSDGMNYGTAFSYAVGSQSNTLTLTDYNGFVLYINGAWVITDISINDGRWHHVCVLWQTVGGMWTIYVDGILRKNGFQLSVNKTIPGSGNFILGQEQDSLGGGFSETESFIGRIYRLDVWNDLLHPSIIENLARECHQSIDGSVLRWEEFSSGIRGRIKIENSSFCSDCPPPKSLWRGTVSMIKAESGLLASYACEEGFVFQENKRGRLIRRCLKHGSWEGSAPICVRRNCGFPGYLPGGTFIGRSFLYTDRVIYKCHSGYQILGNTIRTCEANGKWSGTQPVCKGHSCPILVAPENGAVTLSEPSNLMQTATFSCDPGFHLDGIKKLMCMLDGSWDETLPNCVKRKCPSPPQIEHAVLIGSDNITFHYRDIAQYSCDEQYVMTPPQGTLVCNVNGSWVPEEDKLPPECKPIQCLEPDELKYGKWTPGEKSKTSSLQYSVGSIIQAKCDPNYKMDGPGLKECNINGYWMPLDVTQCAKITCDTELLPYDIPNSQLHFTGEEVGDIVTLTCRDGFKMVSSNSSSAPNISSIQYSEAWVMSSSYSWKCLLDGSWNLMENNHTPNFWFACLNTTQGNQVDDPYCSAPQAPAFGYILNDNNAGEGIPRGSLVHIRCRPGYILEGSSTSVCHSNGTWIDLASAHCKPVQCLNLPHFPNMVVERSTSVGSRVEFGNLIMFKCIPGFKAQGDLSIRCQTNGQWSPMRGTCSNSVTS